MAYLLVLVVVCLFIFIRNKERTYRDHAGQEHYRRASSRLYIKLHIHDNRTLKQMILIMFVIKITHQ